MLPKVWTPRSVEVNLSILDRIRERFENSTRENCLRAIIAGRSEILILKGSVPRRDSAFALPRHCVKHGTVEFVDRNVISEQNWTHSPAFKSKVALAAIRGEERHRVIRPIRFLSPAPLAVTTPNQL